MDFPKSVPGVGLVGGRFVDEDADNGQQGSLIPAVWGNSITEELLAVIRGAGLEPDEESLVQLREALFRDPSGVRRGMPLAATLEEVKAGQNQTKMVAPNNLIQLFTSEYNSAVNGSEKMPSGLIRNWGTVPMSNPIGTYNPQDIGGVTWYTHFYTVTLPRAYTTRHQFCVANLASWPFHQQTADLVALIRTNKTVANTGSESLTSFTLSVCTPIIGWYPTIHFQSQGF